MVQADGLSLVEYDFSNGDVKNVSMPNDGDKASDLEVFQSNTPENIASRIYSENGFEVKHLHNSSNTFVDMKYRGETLNGLLESLENELSGIVREFGGTRLWALDRSGCPDLMVYKQVSNKIEYKFVEVKATPDAPDKNSTDSLRLSQIDWITRFHSLPIKIAFVIDPDSWKGFYEFV